MLLYCPSRGHPGTCASNRTEDVVLCHALLTVCACLHFPSQPVEELQFVWCDLLSEALWALWSSSVTADPERWLKWDPLCPEGQMISSKSPLGPEKMVANVTCMILERLTACQNNLNVC